MTERIETSHPSALRALALLLLGAIVVAPTIAVVGIVLLILGSQTAGLACLLGGIAYRVIFAVSIRAWDRSTGCQHGLV